jgi:hypothetical protein
MSRQARRDNRPAFRERLPVRRWVMPHKDVHDYDRRVNREVVEAEMELYEDEEEQYEEDP